MTGIATREKSARKPVLRLDSVEVDINGQHILEETSLEIGEGEFFCIVGPSGCGKTTLLRLFAGLVSPERGRVLYRDEPVKSPRRDIAFVFQDYTNALLPWRTVAGNLQLALEAVGLPAGERQARTGHFLAKVGLEGYADYFPVQLSGGMQQRLQLARCLAQEPDVFLMDEPFGALDALTKQSLQDEVMRMVKETAATTIFITHDLEEAIYLGDRVAIMQSQPGQIQNIYDITLPRPRNRLSTTEDPEYHRLRRILYDFFIDR